MPSGGLIYCGEKTDAGKQVTLEDLVGWCVIEVYSATVGSLAVIGFGNTGMPVQFSRAIGVLSGVSIGVPGAGGMQYFGRVSRAH
jgi:hypothetical protein